MLDRDLLPNGIDEGVQIMAGRMYIEGFGLYSQINTVQPPLILALYGVVPGDPVLFRYMSAAASVAIIGLVMYIAWRSAGSTAMVAAGAFLSMDLLFLHESRLASLDMFCLLFIMTGMLAFIYYRKSKSHLALAVSGVLLGISAMVKLFGAVAFMGVFLVLIAEMVVSLRPLREKGLGRYLPEGTGTRAVRWHPVLLAASFTVTVLSVMAVFGFGDVFRGVFLNQLDRPVDPLQMRLAYLGLFLGADLIAVLFFPFGLKGTYRSAGGVLLLVSSLFLLMFLLQSKTWPHHYAYLSPTLALTAGMGLAPLLRWKRRRFGELLDPLLGGKYITVGLSVLVVMSGVSGSLFMAGALSRGDPGSGEVADMVRDMTDEGDFVISGDPRITVMAGRLQPPEVVNLALVQSPPMNSEILNRSLIEYGVKVVVVTYRLSDLSGFMETVRGEYVLRARIMDDHLPVEFQEREYLVYAIRQDSGLFSLPEWGTNTDGNGVDGAS